MKDNDLAIQLDTMIIDLLVAHRQTEKVFKKYDTGGGDRIMCQALFTTVGNFARKYNLDPENFIAELHDALEPGK
jgi:hypothetical protein